MGVSVYRPSESASRIVSDAPRPPDIVPNQLTDEHKRTQTQTNANKFRYFGFPRELGDKISRELGDKISRELGDKIKPEK